MSVQHLSPLLMTDRTREPLASVCASLGIECQRIEPLTAPSPGRKQHRRTWKITVAPDTFLKLRQVESAEAAAALVAIRRGVPATFAPIVASHDAFLVERWVDGHPLTSADAESRAHDLGALLASLHHVSLRPTNSVTLDAPRDQAATHLEILTTQHVIDDDVRTRLMAQLAYVGHGGDEAIVHLDFCPENIVNDPRGQLHAIDNEWMRRGAPAADIGRTYARWPAGVPAWQQFIEGYKSVGPVPQALTFWMIAMAAASAVIRLHDSADRLALPVARLTQLATPAAP